MADSDVLPVPAALETQLSKCKTVRESDYYKPRTKTPEVRIFSILYSYLCL
jgi:hypothetical protein